jgi:hypothetical protein
MPYKELTGSTEAAHFVAVISRDHMAAQSECEDMSGARNAPVCPAEVAGNVLLLERIPAIAVSLRRSSCFGSLLQTSIGTTGHSSIF